MPIAAVGHPPGKELAITAERRYDADGNGLGGWIRETMRQMVRRARWRTAAALASGIAVTVAAVLAGSAAPASAGSVNQWRTANVWGSANGSFNSVAATSKTNAWAVGTTSRGSLAARWNGRSWQTVTVPGSRGWAFQQVIAQSASNVWIYAVNTASGREQAFRFDGSHWHPVAFPGGQYDLGSLAVYGPKNAWFMLPPAASVACASTLPEPCTDVWHWNGSTWTDHPIKANIAGLAGISDAATWVVGIAGSRATGIVTAYRWTGRGWQQAKIPHVDGAMPSVAIDSPSDLWISYSNVADTHGYSQHWNGARWQPVPAGGSETPVPDGRGGAWFGPFDHWNGHSIVFVPINQSQLDSAAWSLQEEAVVPGTSGASVWSVGWTEPKNVLRPVVDIYGPTP
jgi:hypothetical protein